MRIKNWLKWCLVLVKINFAVQQITKKWVDVIFVIDQASVPGDNPNPWQPSGEVQNDRLKMIETMVQALNNDELEIEPRIAVVSIGKKDVKVIMQLTDSLELDTRAKEDVLKLENVPDGDRSDFPALVKTVKESVAAQRDGGGKLHWPKVLVWIGLFHERQPSLPHIVLPPDAEAVEAYFKKTNDEVETMVVMGRKFFLPFAFIYQIDRKIGDQKKNVYRNMSDYVKKGGTETASFIHRLVTDSAVCNVDEEEPTQCFFTDRFNEDDDEEKEDLCQKKVSYEPTTEDPTLRRYCLEGAYYFKGADNDMEACVGKDFNKCEYNCDKFMKQEKGNLVLDGECMVSRQHRLYKAKCNEKGRRSRKPKKAIGDEFYQYCKWDLSAEVCTGECTTLKPKPTTTPPPPTTKTPFVWKPWMIAVVALSSALVLAIGIGLMICFFAKSQRKPRIHIQGAARGAARKPPPPPRGPPNRRSFFSRRQPSQSQESTYTQGHTDAPTITQTSTSYRPPPRPRERYDRRR